MENLNINFDIPASVLSMTGLDPKNINNDARKIFAIFLYEHRYISLGKACEIANINKWEFFEMNQKLKIPFQYSNDDLSSDLDKLKSV